MINFGFVNLGLPTKIFEYQSYGKPIICVSDGEPARYVKATKSGLVVKPGDAKDLVAAILKLYNDRNLSSVLGSNGWQYVSDNLTMEEIGKRMYTVLASMNPSEKS